MDQAATISRMINSVVHSLIQRPLRNTQISNIKHIKMLIFAQCIKTTKNTNHCILLIGYVT